MIDLNYSDVPFIHFMRNNLIASDVKNNKNDNQYLVITMLWLI